MYRHPLFVLGFLAVASASAQDSLLYRDGKIITGRVEEIGVELVRYRTASGDAQVLVVAEKRDLARIRLEGGQEFVLNSFTDDVPGSDAFLARRTILSADVIAPALNHAVLGYEHWFARRTSLCVKVGYIGIGIQESGARTYRSRGGLAKLGVKFTLPRPQSDRLPARDRHPLSGWYLEPELVVSSWERDHSSYNPYLTSPSYLSGGLMLNIGRQLFIGERVTFDIHGGLGYAAEWIDGHSTGTSYAWNREGYAFTHGFLGENTILAVTGGVLFGFAL